MSMPFEQEPPGGRLHRLVASEIQRDSIKFMTVLNDYLDVATQHGPGRASADSVAAQWGLLLEAAQNAAYSATDKLRIAHGRLMKAITDYESSNKLLRGHRLKELYKLQDAYRALANEEISKLKGTWLGD